MSGVTTAFPSSLKSELPQALHSFVQTSGNVFYVALIKATPSGTFGAASTNYSDLGADEVTGTGYTAGGFHFTAAQNITPAVSGTAAIWSWSVNPAWTGATFSTDGCMFYNTTNGNRAVYVGSFGGTQSVSAGTFTLVLPANAVGTSILQIS